MEHLVLTYHGRQVSVDGRLLVTAQDGGLLVQGRDGVLWNVEPKDLVRARVRRGALCALFGRRFGRAAAGRAAQRLRHVPHRELRDLVQYQPRIRAVVRRVVRAAPPRVHQLLDAPRLQAFRAGVPPGGDRVRRPRFVCRVCQERSGSGRGIDDRLLQPPLEPDDDVRPDGRGVVAARPLAPQHDGRDQPNPLPAPGRADRGHDRPRGHAPDRLQLRSAHAVQRLPALVQRRARRVLRDARPGQSQRLAERRGASTARDWRSSASICPSGRRTRCGPCWPTTIVCATRSRAATPMPRPGR